MAEDRLLASESVRFLFRQFNRLGDLLMCFPGCLFLARQGHEVFFECDSKYRDIFETVSYVRWAEKGIRVDRVIECTLGSVLEAEHVQDIIYRRHKAIAPAARQAPLFDRIRVPEGYDLPKNYVLFVPYAYSVPVPPAPKILAYIREKRGSLDGVFGLAEWNHGNEGVPFIKARRLSDLPGLIRDAGDFFTVNTGPDIVAAGVRKSYHHFYTDHVGGHCNYSSPNQIVVHLPIR